jgi:hypothetical protein
MTQPGRLAVMIFAAVALVGCSDKKKIRAEYIAADKAVATPTPPSRFFLSTPDAKIELLLPEHIDRYPELHQALFASGKQELMEFAKAAAGDRARYVLKGRHPGQYERKVAWTITAISPRLISLKSAWFADTGGVHPNHGTGSYLWDRDHNQMLAQSELFKTDYDFSALDPLLCDAITKVKAARMGPTDPKSWTCPEWADSRAVLVPSTVPYRVGGLMFLYDPYVIGPYAEGDYEVTIPLSAFQPALAPAWADQFAGGPAAPPPPPPRKAPMKAG